MASLYKGVLIVIAGLFILKLARGECDFSENQYSHSCDDNNNVSFICKSHIDLTSIHNIYSNRGCRYGYMTDITIILRDADIRFEIFDINSDDDLRTYKMKIKTVDVSFNFITDIPLTLYGFDKLERLNCSHNQLTSWTHSDFLKFPSLQKLDLSYNELDSLGESNDDETNTNEGNAAIYAEDTVEFEEERYILPHHTSPVYIVLVSLYLNNNEIKSIPKGFFRNFKNLEILDLSCNMISSLDPSSFSGIENIIYLDISYNRLINLNRALIRLTSLVKLDVNNNEIKAINMHDFAGLDSLKRLTINNNHLNNVDGLFNSMVSIKTVNISHNEITKITKDLLISNEKLTILDMSYNLIDTIEDGAFKNKSQITVLKIEGNQLKGTLIKGQLGGLTQLKTLNINHHKLFQIKDYAFFGDQDLSILNISYNILSLVSKSAFKTLNNLKTLDLSNNVLREITFDTTDLSQLNWISLKNNTISVIPSTFTQPLVSLEFFDVSQNEIMKLASDTFRSLQNLKNIFVGNNPLTGEIVEKTFHNLESLPSLDLSNTNISHLQNDSFNGMKTLSNFNISYSNLSRIEYNTFRETGSLLFLDASHNRLEYFLVNNSQIAHLEVLDLSYNFIIHIRSDTLVNLSRLKMLYLSNNKLRIVEKESLDTLFELSFLDASFNNEINLDISCVRNIKDLILSGNANAFCSEFSNLTRFKLERLSLTSAHVTDLESLKLFKFTKLQTLELSLNDISLINNKSFHSLPMLKMLNLHSNKIATIQTGSFKFIEELLFLNLSHNKISSLNYGIFSGLRNLLDLDLSYNRIHEINVHRLYDVPLLRYLVIDGNEINTINFEEFKKTKVTTISLGDNPLQCQILSDHKNKYRVASDNDSPFNVISIYRPVYLTALTLLHSRENVDGITCKGDVQVHTNHEVNYNMSLSEFVYNSEITNKLLEEIRNILSPKYTNQSQLLLPYNDKKIVENISNRTENSSIWNKIEAILNASRYDVELQSNVSNNILKEIKTILTFSKFEINQTLSKAFHQGIWDKFERILNTSRRDSDIQTNIYNEIKKENTHINEILKYLYADISNNATTGRWVLHEGTLAKMEELTNNTLDKDRLKNELRELFANERKNIINEMKDHLERINNDTVKRAELRSDREDSISVHNYPTNTFTEVCVGIILAITLGFIVYKIYNANKVPIIRSIRSMSTQEISNTMEI